MRPGIDAVLFVKLARLPPDHDTRWLEIPVEDSSRVRLRQRVGRLNGIFQRFVKIHPLALDQLVERFAVDPLHGDDEDGSAGQGRAPASLAGAEHVRGQGIFGGSFKFFDRNIALGAVGGEGPPARSGPMATRSILATATLALATLTMIPEGFGQEVQIGAKGEGATASHAIRTDRLMPTQLQTWKSIQQRSTGPEGRSIPSSSACGNGSVRRGPRITVSESRLFGQPARPPAFMRESGKAVVRSLGVTTPMRVLDLDCGDGTTALPLACSGADVVGTDIARNPVAVGNIGAAAAGLVLCDESQRGLLVIYSRPRRFRASRRGCLG